MTLAPTTPIPLKPPPTPASHLIDLGNGNRLHITANEKGVVLHTTEAVVGGPARRTSIPVPAALIVQVVGSIVLAHEHSGAAL